MNYTKEDLWNAWWQSAIKTVTFQVHDKDYGRGKFEVWHKKHFGDLDALVSLNSESASSDQG